MENIPKKILETYTNIYLGPLINKKEQFQETSSALPTTSAVLPTTSKSDKLEPTYYVYDPITTLVAWIMFFFAIYLSFRCNNGFSVWGFLGAFLFSPIYILYKLTSTPKMCNFIK